MEHVAVQVELTLDPRQARKLGLHFRGESAECKLRTRLTDEGRLVVPGVGRVSIKGERLMGSIPRPATFLKHGDRRWFAEFDLHPLPESSEEPPAPPPGPRERPSGLAGK